jgi:hypothetical protein
MFRQAAGAVMGRKEAGPRFRFPGEAYAEKAVDHPALPSVMNNF